MIFTLFFIYSIFAKDDSAKKVFTINLNDVDSSKDLLKQIYEKADQLGFNFSALASMNKSEGYSNFLAANGAQSTEKTQNTAEPPKKNADKYPKTAAPKNNAAKNTAKTSSKNEKQAAQAKSSKSKAERSKASSKPEKSKTRSSQAKAKTSSSKLGLSKSVSRDRKSSHSKISSEKSKVSSMSKGDKSLSSSVKPSIRSKDASKASSAGLGKSGSSSAGLGKSDSTSSYQDLSKSIHSSIPHSKSVSDFSQTASVSASISSDVIDEVEKIKNMDQDTLNAQINKCEECSKVDGLLVYKDGNIWRDYSGKIEMSMVNGKLTDKTGVFVGKDCSCKKDEIPEIGKVTETGLYQDKQLSQAECEKQSKMIHHLANSNSVMAESASMESGSSVGASTMEGDSTSSVGASTMEGDSTSSVASTQSISADSSTAGGDVSTTGENAPTQSTSADNSIAAGDVSTQSMSSDSSTAGENASTTGENTPTQSMAADNSIQSSNFEQPSTVPQQPPVVFKAIKLKYDLACDDENKANLPSTSAEKQVEYKTQTVTIIDEKKLPPETVFKTITRIVVPETVSKTFTQILKPEVVTITQKPDTVIRYSSPKTVTVTKVKSIEPEISQTSEDMIDEPIQKVLKPSKRKSKPRQVGDEVITKTVKSPYKGVECVPDCPCENEGSCDNPCMEIKCEIVE